MKKLISLLLLTLSAAICHSQIVKGKVLDNNTRKGVHAAYIYFNGTMAVAISDQDGNFELNASRYKDMPLTISAIGYNTHTIANPTSGNPLTILLKPKAYSLNEIKVVGKNSKRREYLQLFKKEFLGADYDPRKCIIENEEDISFNYTRCKDTLEAYAKNPIRINNKLLGYRITFYLDAFKHIWIKDATLYEGSYMFVDTTATDSTLRPKYELARYNAYKGSRMHFFRSLWTHSLEEENFRITDYKGQLLNYNDVVINRDGKKFLNYPYDIFVGIKTGFSRYTYSRVNFLDRMVYFKPDGYYDVLSIRWAGDMITKRIADFLPYEYNAVDPERKKPVRRSSTNKSGDESTIDLENAEMECIYKYTINAPYNKSNTNKKKAEIYTTLLQFNGKISKFCDLNLYRADSIRQLYSDEQLAKEETGKEYKNYLTKKYVFTPVLYKNHPTGKISTLDIMYPDEYIYEENKIAPIWKLKKGSLTVCGYECKKATTSLGGKVWTVWYAPALNNCEGPWKLFGLPGLILKAEDHSKTHQFEITSIRKSNSPITMKMSSNVTWIQKSDFLKIKKLFENEYVRELPLPIETDKREDNGIIISNGMRVPVGSDTEYCPLEAE